ncbi:biofilm surface layer hydrophobin BslB [Bacillus glycinifermentans]|uniref:DUF1016 domain-containing protein n=1 Tax=Bacillus glycinifermentans TaxID=1664069 RepID=A0A0T6BJQ0_9BACI|nr:biofilm surface layer hydrophobin BslB [Bacillus glycinifermentans]ATH93713.1 hypothetical protein COP00_14645 [Bacillus glycinifermentans]KRT90111.1 hypothetical protein AB447_205890 [Bacillus glycinifermentans]MEC0483794.1 DUF1016 domain-containing protein [Bacillus glycinifermentans]MEC3608111.1 DUF1016 domain-containing protein [Bacillus glycinifermentans]UOY87234.1 DUF1016 domain-containing protein [Bacillus glycinifermentans]
MLKRKIISKISIGLLTSAALFSFILPTNEANAQEVNTSHFRGPIFCPPPFKPKPQPPQNPKPDNPLPDNPTQKPVLEVKAVNSNKEWTTSDIEITYKPNTFVGTSYVEFNFPYRFHASTRDTLNGKTLDYTQILNDGQTVRVPVYALSSSEFKLVMVRKTLPNAGTHRITAELQQNGKNINHAEATLEIVPR